MRLLPLHALAELAWGLAAALLLPIAGIAQVSSVQVLPPAGGPGDLFGTAVALSATGDTAIVGAPSDNTAGSNSGAAYVYTRDDSGNWNFQWQLLAPDAAPGDAFGTSVTLSASGDIALVGAPADDVLHTFGWNQIDTGSAHIFFRVGDTWSHEIQLLAGGDSPHGSGDAFGHAVALSDSGLVALVGANAEDIGILSLDPDVGSAYVFEWSPSCVFPPATSPGFCPLGALSAPAAAAGDGFGGSVALSASGDTALVGAGNDDTGFLEGNTDAGSAHIFRRITGAWSHQQQLEAPFDPLFGVSGDRFGFSVALSALGDAALVGASLDDTVWGIDSGSAHVFTFGGGSWSHDQELVAGLDFIGGSSNRLGSAVAFSDSGETALVGAFDDDTWSGSGAGSARLFTKVGVGNWASTELLAPDGANDDAFGTSAALTGTGGLGFIGAPFDDTGFGNAAGSAHAFDFDPDADGVLVPVDNCPLLANLDQLDTDGDSQGDACDDDDDGDGLDDVDEIAAGSDPLNPDTDADGLLDGEEAPAGTDRLNPDTDGDGVLDGFDLVPTDGDDCRSRSPRLLLVWGHATPFGLEHRNDPGIGHLYLRDENASLPGLSATDPSVPANFPDELAQEVTTFLENAQPAPLPPPSVELVVSSVFDADPVPAIGAPGSPSLIYLVDRTAVADPNFGPLGGLAWSGVNRFNRSCRGSEGAVFVDDIPSPDDAVTYALFVDDLVEAIVHEAGHFYGLRHVLPDGTAACVGDVPGPTSAVMDYVPDGSSSQLSECSVALGSGCAITEPPVCSGQETGNDHNPLYHFLHYVIGHIPNHLASLSITPGSWDLESEPLVVWELQFAFLCASCNDPNQVFHDVQFIEVLPGDTEVVRETYTQLTLAQLNALQILIPASSGLKLTFSTVDPSTSSPPPPPNVILEPPVYPPPSAPPPTGTEIVSNLVIVEETSPGVYTTAPMGISGEATTTPQFEIRSSGTYDLTTPAEPQLTPSTYVPPLTVSAAPEPSSLLQGLAGLAALAGIQQHRRRRRTRERDPWRLAQAEAEPREMMERTPSVGAGIANSSWIAILPTERSGLALTMDGAKAREAR